MPPKRKNPTRGTPQAHGDAQTPIGCSHAPGEQATKGHRLSPGEGAPSRDQRRDHPVQCCPPRPKAQMAKGLPRPQPGSWGAAWLPHGSQPTGSSGHSSGCSEAGAATGSRKRNLLRSRPGPSTSSVSPQRPAARPGTLRPRLCGRLCDRGLGPLAPLPCPLGGPCTPHGNRAAALSPGPSGARRDSWVRGRSAPLECFRGRRPGSRPFQSDLCNFNSNLKQVRHVLGHIQVLLQPQGLRGGERPPRACPAALLVCRGRGQAPVQELVAVLTLGLQHWEAPHPAWASSGPWGGNRRQEALEPPALLYLDIPEPRSSAWPAAAPEHAAMEGQGQESQTGNLPEGTDAGPLGGFLPSDRNVRAKGCTEARGPAREPPPGAPQQAAGCWATDGRARRPRGRRAPAQHRDRARVPPHVPAPGRAGTPEPRSQGRPSAR